MRRTDLAAVAAFLASQNPTSTPTVALSDADAVELALDVGLENARFPEVLADGIEKLEALPAPPSADDPDALATWANAKTAASAKFWDAYAGEVVDGVTIIRKR